jgi:hypothetical protein
MSKDSTSTPSIPDYSGLTTESSRLNTQLNRYNQYTPLGQQTWSKNGDNWSLNTQLSPNQQALQNQNEQLSNQIGGITSTGLNNVAPLLSSSINPSSLPAAPINAGQTAQDAIMSRLNPTWNTKQSGLENQLTNQGITRGSEAWGNAFRDFNYARNDAETQAALQGISTGQNARNASLQEQIALRNQPINELNSLRQGMQVTMPQFGNYAQAQSPDLTGAAQQQYNSQMGLYNAGVAQNNNTMSGLFGLGSAALGSFM